MIIEVKGYASLKRFTAHLSTGGTLTVPKNATVASILKKLQVPSNSMVVTMINGRHCTLDQRLVPGDKLVFFPPLEGG
jgi:molybdopterin converting factor small subunit